MDQRSFDRLARLLGEARDRRTGLKALAGAMGLLGAGGLAALDAAAAATGKRKGDGRRRADDAEEDRKKKRKKGCKPACTGGYVCEKVGRKRRCVCPSGIECGASCCTVGQSCVEGVCTTQPGPDPDTCVPAGEPCKASGRSCCDGRVCASGQGGEADVACYVPKTGRCQTTVDCVYGMSCQDGRCAPPPPAGLGETCGGAGQQGCADPRAVCGPYTVVGAPAGDHCTLPLQATCSGDPQCGCYRCGWPAAMPGRSGRRDRAAGGLTETTCCGAPGHPCSSNADCCEGASCTGGVCAGTGCTVMPDGSGKHWTIAAALAAGETDIALGAGTYRETGLSVADATVAIRRCGAGKVTVDLERKGRFLTVGADASVTLTGFTVTNGKVASGNGGALLVDGGATARLELVAMTISDSEATTGGGGGVTNSGGTLVIRESAVTGCKSVNGGGIRSRASGSLAIDDSVISGNGIVPGSFGDGGGISVSGGSPTLSNLDVLGNAADFEGGGVYYAPAAAGDELTVANCRITGNTAKRGGGGLFLYNDSASRGATGTVSGGTISGNTVERYGGGVGSSYVALTLDGVTIADNVSSGVGGGAWLIGWNGNEPVITGATVIERNSAATFGGGLYIDWFADGQNDWEMTIDGDAKIRGNTAGTGGGGIYQYGTSGRIATPGLTLTITDNVQITGNTVTGANGTGGGIQLTENELVTISGNVLISGNTATGDGGGIHDGRGVDIGASLGGWIGDLQVTGSARIAGNVSGGMDGAGSGIFRDYGKTITCSQTPTVCGNPGTAATGTTNCASATTGTGTAGSYSGCGTICAGGPDTIAAGAC